MYMLTVQIHAVVNLKRGATFRLYGNALHQSQPVEILNMIPLRMTGIIIDIMLSVPVVGLERVPLLNVQVTLAAVIHAVVKTVTMLLLNTNALNQSQPV